MAYGIRLNVEAVFWRAAMEYYETAEKSVEKIDHFGETINGYSTHDVLASACMAVVCFAICVEAAINCVWSEVVSPKFPNDRNRKRGMRSNSVNEKLDDISEVGDEQYNR